MPFYEEHSLEVGGSAPFLGYNVVMRATLCCPCLR